MAVVGNNLGQSFLAAAKPVANRNVSSSKPGAKESSASSSSSPDFAKIFNQKESGSNKNNQAKNNREKIDTYVAPRENNEKPPRRVDERADLPSAPGKGMSGLPSRLEGRELNQRLPVREGVQDSGSMQSKIENRETDESVDNLAHRQALQQLLKRMKDEFNLDAEQIVGAFAQLSGEELQQPPEATLDKIIQGLPLNPEQQVIAKSIFQDMLKQTAANGMADYLTASHRQLSLEVMSNKEAQARATKLAVDQMQSNFFAQAQSQPKPAVNPQAGLSKYKNQQADSDSDSSGLMAMMAAATAAGAATVGAASESAQSAAPAANPQAAIAQAQKMITDANGEQIAPQDQSGNTDWQKLGMQKVEGEHAAIPLAAGAKPAHHAATNSYAPNPAQAQVAQLPAAMNEKEQTAWLNNLLKDQSGEGAQNLAPQAAAAAAPTAASAPASAASNVMPALSLSALGLSESNAGAMNSDGDEEASQDGGADMNKLGAQALTKNSNDAKVSGPESFVIQTKPTENQEANNIRQMVNEAQVLARKGGGEMKMILSPEGLGQLTMKVNVENGRVNVEMVADSSEAKKLIEKGLGELKATLISHNLKVDQIKVDLPADVSKQMDMNQNDAQRNNAQQFMEQFRQQNNEWRRGFFDIGGAKMYNSQKDESARSTMPQPENNRRAGSRRLDLVA